jgi:hypothetical protein
MYAQTVEEHVDRHVAPLVDAINRSGRAATYSSCSGHMKDSGFPFVAFRTEGWEFVGSIRRMITEVNHVTRGQTLLEIAPFSPEGLVSAVVRFRMYPWLWASEGINLAPLAVQLVVPPPRLVRLWWAEIAEVGRMIEMHDQPGAAFGAYFLNQQWSGRGFPWWGARSLSISPPHEHATDERVARFRRPG